MQFSRLRSRAVIAVVLAGVLGTFSLSATAVAVEPAHSQATEVLAAVSRGHANGVPSDRTTRRPVILSISPSEGPLAGGTTVVVTGRNLGDATKVTFGGRAGSDLVVESATRVRVTTPDGGRLGSVGVTAVAAGSSSRPASLSRFTYVLQRPAITGVAPDQGPLAGDTTVVITGEHLSGVTEVTFGGRQATGLQVVSDTEVRVITPEGRRLGTVDVRATSRAGSGFWDWLSHWGRGGMSVTSRHSSTARFTYVLGDTTAPAVPQGEAATPGDAQVVLTWDPVSDSDLAGYEVYQADASNGPWAKLPGGPLTTPTSTVTSLTNGTTYWFTLTAVDTAGNESAPSPAVSGTPTDLTPPGVPHGLVATPGAGQVVLAWDPVTDADLAGYELYQSAGESGPWTKLEVGPLTETTSTVTGLANGTTYWFTLTTVDSAGNESEPSTPVSATPNVTFEALWESDPVDVSVMEGTTASLPLVLTITGPDAEVGLTVGGDLAHVGAVDTTALGANRFEVVLTVSIPVQHVAEYTGTLQVTHHGEAEGDPLTVRVTVTVPDNLTIPQSASTPTEDRIGELAGSPVLSDELIVTIGEDVADPDAAIRRIAAEHGAVLIGSVPSARMYELRFPGTVVGDLPSLDDALSADVDVDLVMLALLGSSDATVNDPEWTGDWSADGESGTNWALKMINAPEAWDTTTGEGVHVGVIDVGFDTSHEDLTNRIVLSTGPGNEPSHGTHVAGTICAEGNNGVGISGVAYDCSMSVYAISGGGTTLAKMIEAMHIAATAEPRPRVVNISYGWDTEFDCTASSWLTAEQSDLSNQVLGISEVLAAEAGYYPNVLWVFSAGNEGLDAECSAGGRLGWGVSNVISVAAVDDGGDLASFSNRGDRVTVAAPGVGILSTLPRSCDPLSIICGPGRYGEMSGTSMAAPHVTGVAALAFAANPELTASQARTCVIRPDSLGGVSVPGQPFNLVDAAATVECAKSGVALRTLKITTTTLPVATVGQDYSVQLSATGGNPPYQWGEIIDTSPLWVDVTPEGQLGIRTGLDPFGFPYQVDPGTYPLDVSVLDSNGASTKTTLTLTVTGDTTVESETTLISRATDGTQGIEASFDPSISGDGRWITFTSSSSRLGGVNTVGNSNVFVTDRNTGETTLVSRGFSPAISTDGRWITYQSFATDLVPGDTNGLLDVFVTDRTTGETTLVSRATDGTQGNDQSRFPAISGDGRWITYESDATDLVPGDTNGLLDVFVWDRDTGETTLVSRATDGTQGNGQSRSPAISGDGRWITYESLAWNLVGEDTSIATDVFVTDRTTGETTLVSVAIENIEARSSEKPAISGDGRWITYTSWWPGTPTGGWTCFLWDRTTGETTMVSDGTQTHTFPLDPSISGDGRWITYYSTATMGDVDVWRDVLVWDRATGETALVSGTADGTEAYPFNNPVMISGDGRWITYYSAASNLVPEDTNGKIDVFVSRNSGAD